jgi:dTDP-4-amino-4,6-dideoxygalactose transaminase
MKVPFVDLGAQHAALADPLQAAMAAVVRDGAFILGGRVSQFESELGSYLDVSHVVGVGNGLDALRLSLLALGIGPGDEVITAANTFIATALAIAAAGARPVLVDCDETTFNIDPRRIEAALTPRTRAIIPVHLYGRVANLDAVMAIARERGLHVVEDAAQAHGARMTDGRRAGTIGDAGCFSFYPSKNLGACGDGGALVTNDAGLAQRARQLRNYGQSEKYHHDVLGINSRLDGVQAAVLSTKLPHLDGWNDRRRAIAAAYREGLAGLPLTLPGEGPAAGHVHHLFVVRCRDRERLRSDLTAAGIETGIHYPIPIHRQAAFAGAFGEAQFPVTEMLATEILSLPMYPEMTSAQVGHVVGEVRRSLGR